MTIQVTCSCGAKYRINDSLQGKSARCKKCGSLFQITEPEAASENDEWGGLLSVNEAEAGTRIAKKAKPQREEDDDDDEEEEETKPTRKRRKKKTAEGSSTPLSLEERIASREGVSAAEQSSSKIKAFFSILFGVAIIYCSQLIYAYFAAWEAGNGGPRRMHVIFAIAYWIGGKLGAAIIVALFGGMLVLGGFLELIGRGIPKEE